MTTSTEASCTSMPSAMVTPPANTPASSSTTVATAMMMFWRITRTVRRAAPIAWGRRSRLSPISATSAVSTATAEPAAPMATPMSAAARAGASFTPSPTIATVCPPRCSSRTISSLSSGSSDALTSVMPVRAAIACATGALSPVSMTMRLTPTARSSRTICAASARTVSATATTPSTCPSSATSIGVLPAAASSPAAAAARAPGTSP